MRAAKKRPKKAHFISQLVNTTLSVYLGYEHVAALTSLQRLARFKHKREMRQAQADSERCRHLPATRCRGLRGGHPPPILEKKGQHA